MHAATARHDIVDADDLPELLRRLNDAQRLVRRATSKRGSGKKGGSRLPCPSVLRADVLDAFAAWPRGRHADDAPVGVRMISSKDGADALPQEIERRVGESTVPVRIPELLRTLGISAEEGKRALLHGAKVGLFGLEPESGMGRLSETDAKLCPEGPDGTRLSWVVARGHRKGVARP